MSSFYSDLKGDFGTRHKKGFYSNIPFYLKVRSNPSQATSLKQQFRLTREEKIEEGKSVRSYYSGTEATLKSTCYNKQIDTKLKVNNSDASYSIDFKPSSLNNDNSDLVLGHSSSVNLGAERRVDSTESIQYGSPEVGPVSFWTTLALNWNTQNKDKVVEASAVVSHKDSHVDVGVHVTHEHAGDEKTNSVEALGRLQTRQNEFMLHGNFSEKTVSFASNSLPSYKPDQFHSCELTFFYDTDASKKFTQQRFYGQPITITWGGEYIVSPVATFKPKLQFDSDTIFSYAWIQRINPNLKVGFSHELNVTRALGKKTTSTEAPFNFGAMVQLDL